MLHLLSNPGFEPPTAAFDWAMVLIAVAVVVGLCLLVGAVIAIRDRDAVPAWFGAFVGVVGGVITLFIACAVGLFINSDDDDHLRTDWQNHIASFLHDDYGISVSHDDVESLTAPQPDPLVVTYKHQQVTIKLVRGAHGELAVVNNGNMPLDPIGE